ncbi:hypothetical protein EDC04DRAFT_2890779 [Pisolithus marmoratus]|nr:hypothetical protein EDC04DRAFT_2890779 [Pisolithus marmoratus]
MCWGPNKTRKQLEGYQDTPELGERNPTDSLHLALAYYAYALGRPEECLGHLSKVSKLVDAQSHIPVRHLRVKQRSTPSRYRFHDWLIIPLNRKLRVYHFVSIYSRYFEWKNLGHHRITPKHMFIQGMCYETFLYPTNPERAIEAYAVALPLLSIIEFETLRAPDAQSSQALFVHCRGTMAVGRTTHVSRHHSHCACTAFGRAGGLDMDVLHALPSVWRLLDTNVQILSSVHRCRPPSPCSLLKHRIPSEQVPVEYLLAASDTPTMVTRGAFRRKRLRSILDKCTRFPRAGERNVKVEDFVDLCVAFGKQAVDVGQGGLGYRYPWWATKLTFNSYRIFRHMSRLLKSREASTDNDSDTDRHWVEALVEGSRTLCRLAVSRPGWDGLEEAKEAGELIEKAKTRLDRDDKELVARVALAEGVWHTVSGVIETAGTQTWIYENDRKRFALALEQFMKSVGTYPTPAAHHHLAIALALPGPSQDLKQAIAVAGAAVEDEALDIRHWHLLGLLLTAEGQWDKAKSILEIGANIGEATSEPQEDGTAEQEPVTSDVKTKDFFDTEKTPTQVSEKSSSQVDASDINETPIPAQGSKFSEPLLDRDATSIPPSVTLLKPLPDHPPPSRVDGFEYALQLRLTQMALTEHVEGAESAEIKWVNVYSWIAERKGSVSDTPLRSSVDTSSRSATTQLGSMVIISMPEEPENEKQPNGEPSGSLGLITAPEGSPPPITVTPATPADAEYRFSISGEPQEKVKRTASMGADPSTGRKVQQMLKDRVHKGQEKISTISRKIGHGVVRSSNLHLRRSSSAPDFYAVLQNHQYQASSIHSRRRLRSLIRHNHHHEPPAESPPAPPPPPLPPVKELKTNPRVTREDKLLSDLWAASAATFRRRGKIDQAKGAIQEAEVKNPDNPNVWVQFGLYHHALGHERQAAQAFQKALFISPDDVSAAVHMSRLYLDSGADGDVDMDKVDLAAGLLGYITRSRGWNVPEAWYYLAKAYGLQGRKEQERECLVKALKLTEQRCIRDIGLAVEFDSGSTDQHLSYPP